MPQQKQPPEELFWENPCPKSYRNCPLVTKDFPSFKNLESLSPYYSALKLFTGLIKAAFIAW